MFIHNFKYSLKTLLRNKPLIFWTFAFPLIIGTFFNLAFSNIENSEKLNIIDIAIIDNDDFNNNKIFKTAFDKLSDVNDETRLFEIKYTNLEEAKKLLNDSKIIGYMELINDSPKLTFITTGINQTVFKYVVEEITQTSDIVKVVVSNEIDKELINGNYDIDYQSIYSKALEIVEEDNTKINDISSNNLSYTMIEFYSLIAMACLYGGILGAIVINQNLANMSDKGKRVAVSAVSKIKVILSGVLASYVTQAIGVILLFAYTTFILNVDYGSNLGLVVLLAMVGCLAGLSLGVIVATIFRCNDNAKIGIIVVTTMLGCFLSGMMGITMKYIVDKNIPIINKLNPASMITDGLYSLYYYDTLDRYIFDVASLFIFAFVLITISCISLRRQKYDSV